MRLGLKKIYTQSVEGIKHLYSKGSELVKRNTSKMLGTLLLAGVSLTPSNDVQQPQVASNSEAFSIELQGALSCEEKQENMFDFNLAEKLACYQDLAFEETRNDPAYIILVKQLLGSYGLGISYATDLWNGGEGLDEVKDFQRDILGMTGSDIDGMCGPLSLQASFDRLGYAVDSEIYVLKTDNITDVDKQGVATAEIAIRQSEESSNMQPSGENDQSSATVYQSDTVQSPQYTSTVAGNDYQPETTNTLYTTAEAGTDKNTSEMVSDSISSEIVTQVQFHLVDTLSAADIPQQNIDHLVMLVIKALKGEKAEMCLQQPDSTTVIRAELSIPDTTKFMGEDKDILGRLLSDNPLFVVHHIAKITPDGGYEAYPTGRSGPISAFKVASRILPQFQGTRSEENLEQSIVYFDTDNPGVNPAFKQFQENTLPEHSPYIFEKDPVLGWMWMNKHLGIWHNTVGLSYTKYEDNFMQLYEVIRTDSENTTTKSLPSSYSLYTTEDGRLLIKKPPTTNRVSLRMRQTYGRNFSMGGLQIITDTLLTPTNKKVEGESIYFAGYNKEKGVRDTTNNYEYPVHCNSLGAFINGDHLHKPETHEGILGTVEQQVLGFKTTVGNEGISVGPSFEGGWVLGKDSGENNGPNQDNWYVSTNTHATYTQPWNANNTQLSGNEVESDPISNPSTFDIDISGKLTHRLSNKPAGLAPTLNGGIHGEGIFSNTGTPQYEFAVPIGGGIEWKGEQFQFAANISYDILPRDLSSQNIIIDGGFQRLPSHTSPVSVFSKGIVSQDIKQLILGSEQHANSTLSIGSITNIRWLLFLQLTSEGGETNTMFGLGVHGDIEGTSKK